MDGMTEPRKTMKIGAAALGGLQASPDARSAPFEAPKLPPGVIPKGAALAMDWGGCDPYAYANSGFMDGFGLGIGFIGYPVLAELIQIAEFRNPSEIYAEEMTRMWIKLRATGDSARSSAPSPSMAASMAAARYFRTSVCRMAPSSKRRSS
jgi:hypothetical protein